MTSLVNQNQRCHIKYVHMEAIKKTSFISDSLLCFMRSSLKLEIKRQRSGDKIFFIMTYSFINCYTASEELSKVLKSGCARLGRRTKTQNAIFFFYRTVVIRGQEEIKSNGGAGVTSVFAGRFTP